MSEIEEIGPIAQLQNSLNEAHHQRALAEQIWREENAALKAELTYLRAVAEAAEPVTKYSPSGKIELCEAINKLREALSAWREGQGEEEMMPAYRRLVELEAELTRLRAVAEAAKPFLNLRDKGSCVLGVITQEHIAALDDTLATLRLILGEGWEANP